MGAANKVTFTLDHDTVHRIEDASQRLAFPKSQVVREAIAEYHARLGHMSDRERLEKLRLFDAFVPKIPLRSPGAVAQELKEIRLARRAGGRGSGSGNKA
jgi:predicted DNA-binding protein